MSSTSKTLLDGDFFPSPLALFLFQVIFITCLSRVLIWILAKLRQPAVIAEMIAGILLGPSALSRIPGFSALIFPAASVRIIQVISQLGLVIFMFLVGTELDSNDFKDNFKQVTIISGVGVLIPCLIAIPATLLVDDPKYSLTSYPELVLFNGVAIGMSALPVLARILAEHNMLRSKLGQLIMGATAVDDVFAWCLLAIVVAVVRASNQLHILYVMLLSIADLLFVVFVVRPLLERICRKVEDRSHVTPQIFFFIMIILLAVSYITEAIGLSSLIGAFQVGLVLPRKRALISTMTQKLEDLIIVILMPLFFTNSGLRTNFFLLTTAVDWGMCVYYIVIATGAKVIAIFIPARCLGLSNRDSLAFGVLMSCKGLVALIVINFGVDYEMITPKLFSILVVMVLITSLLTVPLTELVLPLKTFHKPAIESGDEEHGAQSLAVVEMEPITNVRTPAIPSQPRLKSQANDQIIAFGELSRLLIPVPLNSLISVRVLICATNFHNNSLISLAASLVKKRSGDAVFGSQCLTYRPISPNDYTYVHSLASLSDRDDVLKALVERADVHQLEVQFMPIPVPATEVPSQALGVAYSHHSDILLVGASFSSDLQANESVLRMVSASRCVTAVLMESKQPEKSWPLADVRSVLVILVPGVHGAAALQVGQVLAANGASVTAMSVPSLPYDRPIPDNISLVSEKEEEAGEVSVEISSGLFPGANAVLHAVENEVKDSNYSLVILPDLLMTTPACSPRKENLITSFNTSFSDTYHNLNQISIVSPVLLVRAPGDASVHGSFVLASLNCA